MCFTGDTGKMLKSGWRGGRGKALKGVMDWVASGNHYHFVTLGVKRAGF